MAANNASGSREQMTKVMGEQGNLISRETSAVLQDSVMNRFCRTNQTVMRLEEEVGNAR